MSQKELLICETLPSLSIKLGPHVYLRLVIELTNFPLIDWLGRLGQPSVDQ